MINFSEPYLSFRSKLNGCKAIFQENLVGNGLWTEKLKRQISYEYNISINNIHITNSCTSALEISLRICKIKYPNKKKVILPSYTFSSSANCLVLAGFEPIFCDVDKLTGSMRLDHILDVYNPEEVAGIICVHYGGGLCDIENIKDFCNAENLFLVEDAAQAYGLEFKNNFAGKFGDFGCFSFHSTKVLSAGEIGLLIVRDSEDSRLAAIISEKGTNRIDFINGKVEKYTWVHIGSSYHPSDYNSAILLGQLASKKYIEDKYRKDWLSYFEISKKLLKEKKIESIRINKYCLEHNGHNFSLFLKRNQRDHFIDYMKRAGIQCTTHYEPLHKSWAKINNIPEVNLKNTDWIHQRIVRLPMHMRLDIIKVINNLKNYFSN
tara:strand:- start:3683 stop:4816 length:1134 start_codon:yes stop_codon:yes gene_type:complete